MREWKPHADFSRYLIPGSPGRIPAERVIDRNADNSGENRKMFRSTKAIGRTKAAKLKVKEVKATLRAAKAKAAKATGEAVRAAQAELRCGEAAVEAAMAEAKAAAAADAARLEDYPTFHLEFPRAPISIDGEKIYFLVMCRRAAATLRLSTSRGGQRHQDFLVFAAAFASMNPTLWKDILQFHPGRAKLDPKYPWENPTKEVQVQIWRKLATKLEVLCHRHPTNENKILRSTAAWLFRKLKGIESGKPKADKQAEIFFERFKGGRNIAEAKENWNELIRRFDEENKETEWGSELERDMEFQMFCESKGMEEWQAQRMKILIWPGANARKKSA